MTIALTHPLRVVLDQLRIAARFGAPCPSNRAMNVQLCYSQMSYISQCLKGLEGLDAIKVERAGGSRRVYVKDVGLWTGWGKYGDPPATKPRLVPTRRIPHLGLVR